MANKYDFLNKIGLGNAWTNIKNYINSFTYSKTELNTKLDEKASDSDVVHKSGNESISGIKTFSSSSTYFGRDVCCYSTIKYGKKINPTTNSYQYVFFCGNTISNGTTNNWYGGYLEQVVMSNGASRGRWFVRNTDEQTVSVELLASMDGARTLRPTNNNVITLGLTSHKWADVNTTLLNGKTPAYADDVVKKTSIATEQQVKDLFTNEPTTGARFLTTDDVCTEQQIKDLFNE